MGAWTSQRDFLILTYKRQVILYKIIYPTLFLASEFILNYKLVLFIPLTPNLEYIDNKPMLCKAINLQMLSILYSGNVTFCCLKVTYYSRSVLNFSFETTYDTQFNSQHGQEFFNSLLFPDQLCTHPSPLCPLSKYHMLYY
jgi:hypothetical protein